MSCSTIIVGKDVSATGRVLVGHNEDDPKAIAATYLVPRKKHEKGETITFDDGSAVIPQPEETYAYFWSATENENYTDIAYSLYLGNGDADVDNIYKDIAFSVRCLKDSP